MILISGCLELVYHDKDYIYSSALNYTGLYQIIDVDYLFYSL
jgi:hypothetical protein